MPAPLGSMARRVAWRAAVAGFRRVRAAAAAFAAPAFCPAPPFPTGKGAGSWPVVLSPLLLSSGELETLPAFPGSCLLLLLSDASKSISSRVSFESVYTNY